ncbi:MAG: DUF2298 domain-containing protein, partial [Chloroflexota bacterium]
PFFLHFRSLADGLGVVTTRSDIFQFIQVFGLFLAGAVLLVGSLAWLVQPEPESLDLSAERGSVTLGFAAGQGGLSSLVLAGGLIALAILASLFQLWPLLIDLVLGSAGAFVLWRVLNTNQPRPNDVLALTAVGVACLVLALTELIYLRDVFAGGADYRMNTVFKFYYQAWVLLGLAGAYGAYRGWGILRRFAPRGVALLAIGLLSLGAAGGAVYTVLAPATTYAGAGIQSLNGMAWLAKSAPGDYDAIVWLRAHASSHAVELEAVGNDYSTAARVSTFTGMPAVMGWIGHEQQWRIGNADIAVRAADVKTVYTTTNESVARRLLYHYRVQYVIVGQQERDIQGVTTASLDKFGHFMRLAFRSHGTSIYTWR